MASGGITSVDIEGGFFTLAATALCCYEHIITFDDEVRCIWRRRISGATVLFVLNRYAILVVSLASIVQVLPWNTQMVDGDFPEKTCSAVIRSIDTLLIVVNIAYAVFAALRMFALYSMRKSILALVLAVGLLNPCTQIFLMCTEVVGVNRGREPIGTSIASPVGRINCYHSIANTLASSSLYSYYLAGALEFTLPALRCHALIFEGLLIGLTSSRTVTLQNLKHPVIRTPFSTALLRNGTLYFLVIATVSMLNMVGMWVLLLHPSTVSSGSSYVDSMVLALASLGPIVDTITSVCMSRFILNLVVISLDEGSSYARSSQWKTLRFATVAESVATFGADLSDHLPETGSTTDSGELPCAVG